MHVDWWLAIDIVVVWSVAFVGLGWPLVAWQPRSAGRIAIAACLGATITTVINGWLVVAGAFGSTSCLVVLAAGLISAAVVALRAVARLRRRQALQQAPDPRSALQRGLRLARRLPKGWWLVTLIGLVAFVAMLIESSYVAFNHEDDFKGYFVMPARMLATGDYPGDPFNCRQFMAYGAASSLHAGELATGGSPMALRMLGRLGGGVLLSVVLFGLARRFGGVRVGLLAATMPWLILASWLRLPANVMPHYALGGLFALIALTELCPPRGTERPVSASGSWRTGLLLGLCAVLKQTMLAPLGLLLLTAGLIATARRVRTNGWRSALARLTAWSVGVIAVALLVALPWLLVKARNYGTAIYPLTGDSPAVADVSLSGIDVAEGGSGLLAPVEMMIEGGGWAFHIVLAALVSLVALAVVLRQQRWRQHRGALLAVVVAAVGTLLCFASVTRWLDADRYSGPMMVVAAALCLALAGGRWHTRDQTTRVWTGLLVLLAAGAIWHLTDRIATYVNRYEAAIASRVSAGLADDRPPVVDLEVDWLQERYEGAIGMVPEGDTVLHIGTYPAGLPFDTHRIWCLDWPGYTGFREAAVDQSGSDLRDRLAAVGVQWVLIDSLDLRSFNPDVCAGFYGRQVQSRLGTKSPYRLGTRLLLRWLYELIPRLLQQPDVTVYAVGQHMWLVNIQTGRTPVR